jgi:protein-S-isoprenylcysteine O-methyltransferase Ste14
METGQGSVAIPRWYEWRSGVFALLYALGFLGGWAAAAAAGRSYVPAFRQIGEHYGRTGGTIAVAGALLCVVVAVATRLWASSYLSEDRVWSKDAQVDALVIAGPFRYCRHPLYAANIALAVGLGSLAPLWGWIFIVVSHVVFVRILIAREERLFAADHEAEYAHYRQHVPALIPRFPPVALSGPARRPSWAQGLRTESLSLFIIAGAASFFIFPRFAGWILGAAYVIAVFVQRRIEK